MRKYTRPEALETARMCLEHVSDEDPSQYGHGLISWESAIDYLTDELVHDYGDPNRKEDWEYWEIAAEELAEEVYFGKRSGDQARH